MKTTITAPGANKGKRFQRKLPTRPVVVSDWSILIGAHVHVTQDSQRISDGRVEEVTGDGTTAWIVESLGFSRRLIDKGSGYELLLSPDQMQEIGRKQP